MKHNLLASRFSEALPHAVVAALIALLVGLALAALIDWAARRKEDAIVEEIKHRCLEGVLAGFIEGFLGALIFAGMSLT